MSLEPRATVPNSNDRSGKAEATQSCAPAGGIASAVQTTRKVVTRNMGHGSFVNNARRGQAMGARAGPGVPVKSRPPPSHSGADTVHCRADRGNSSLKYHIPRGER